MSNLNPDAADKTSPFTISIDFDGVIVRDEYPVIGDPLPGMLEAMRTLHARGCVLIINTCRAGKYANQAVHALEQFRVPYDHFNKNSPERTNRFGSDCRKISADLYIDDKNLGGFPGWAAVLNEITE